MATTSVAAAPGRPAPGPEVTPTPARGSGARSSPPSSTDQLPASTRGPCDAAASLDVPATFEPDFQDASLAAAHRDGRIRNPVPSKLQGKTDGSKGNFIVMHMEVSGKSDRTDRGAEAKRTSESTELAAKRALEHGYVSVRRSRFIHLPDEPVAKPFIPAPTSAPASTQPQRRFPLSPEDTKSEQARLLTLLRSLHPVLVVDQICKALAFFGGIPGAPPPPYGGFPESAEANGPGSVFVGWIAEIFPKLGGNSAQPRLEPARQLDNPQPVKRKRGRPKGSKTNKFRKDKGIKKGSMAASSSVDQHQPSDVVDGSWVDVSDDAMAVTNDACENSTPVPLAESTCPPPQQAPPRLTAVSDQASGASARTALPGAPIASGATADGMSSVRKRGRPKGSKNRPKHLLPTLETLGQTSHAGAQPSEDTGVPAPAPQVLQNMQTPENSVAPQSFTAVDSLVPAPTKKRPGRPRGSGSKRQAQGQQGVSPGLGQQGLTTQPGLTNAAPPAPVQTPTHQTPQIPQESPGQSLTLSTAPVGSPAQAKAASSSTRKRKRKGEKDGDVPEPNSDTLDNRPNPSLDLDGRVLPTPPNDPRTPPLGTASEPAPKRQRKAKEPRQPARMNEAAPVGTTGSIATPPAAAFTTDSGTNSNPVLGRAPPQAVTPRPEPRVISISAEEPSVQSVHPPEQSHFEVQSPTIENYEAQLQAQLEQQTNAESETLGSQSRPGSAQLTGSQLPPQPVQQQPVQSQQQKHVQQRQQQQQRAPAGHGRSPKLQTQPTKSPAASSPLVTQQQAKASQKHHSQHRTSTSQYHHQQQPQQNYVAPHTEQPQAHHQQQFSGGQQLSQSAQVPPAQQYPTGPSQPHQYASSQQQYSGGQQQLASQPRYQHQLATTSAGAAPYATHPSPQFNASASNNFGAADVAYRSPTASLTNPSYGQRSQSAASSATTSFRANSHSLPQHSGTFGSGTTAQPTTQSMQALAGVQAFTGNAGTEWGLFDAGQLEASGQQGTMGLSNANYGISAASMRTSSSTAPAFAATGLPTFDSSSLSNTDRYYGVGRR